MPAAIELMTTMNRDLCEAIRSELEWDTNLARLAIEVQVDGPLVILSGTVGSWAERLAAQDAAKRVAGVREVNNKIAVQSTRAAGLTDAALAESLRSTLDRDVFISRRKIRCGVSSGKVVLEGEVDCCAQRDDVERAVRNVRGVRSVLNQISVRPTDSEAHELQQAIESAVERRIDTDARNVYLDVHDGKVILSGVVHCWAERQSVVAAARGTRGVRSVDDRLSVEPER
jgi:osmotically-inducible protein OsmY